MINTYNKFSQDKDSILPLVFSLYPSYKPSSCLYIRPTYSIEYKQINYKI